MHENDGTGGIERMVIPQVPWGRVVSVLFIVGALVVVTAGTALAQLEGLTLRHLLTMTSGLDWNEANLAEYIDWQSAAKPTAHYLSRDRVRPLLALDRAVEAVPDA